MQPGLPCDNLLVGVSGSIHALNIHTYLSRFRESLATNLRVIVTESACQIIRPETVRLFASDRVFVDLWGHSESIHRAPHIQLSRWADLFVVVPATANVLGKAANGIADDLLTTTILAYRGTIVFAPAMNPSMWESPAVQRNRTTLERDGHYVVTPEAAVSVTSGEWDAGLAPSPDTLLPHLHHVLMRRLKSEYWPEAVRAKPLSPAQKKLRALASRVGSAKD